MKNIKLIEVPSEIGAGTRGASLGVEAIKIAAMDFMSNFYLQKNDLKKICQMICGVSSYGKK